MEPNDYVVDRIEGDYAYLRLRDGSSDEELFIAMALLPDGTAQGSSGPAVALQPPCSATRKSVWGNLSIRKKHRRRPSAVF